jgi:hypothetical protein
MPSRSSKRATIKPTTGDSGKLFAPGGRNLHREHNLADLITFGSRAARKADHRAFEWMASEKFDIRASRTATTPNQQQWKTMVQKLWRTLRWPSIATARNWRVPNRRQSGPKLTGEATAAFLDVVPRPRRAARRNASMADFAGVMQAAVLDRPVVDQTKLAGKFDSPLTWTPDDPSSGMGVRVPPLSGDAPRASRSDHGHAGTVCCGIALCRLTDRSIASKTFDN